MFVIYNIFVYQSRLRSINSTNVVCPDTDHPVYHVDGLDHDHDGRIDFGPSPDSSVPHGVDCDCAIVRDIDAGATRVGDSGCPVGREGHSFAGDYSGWETVVAARSC